MAGAVSAECFVLLLKSLCSFKVLRGVQQAQFDYRSEPCEVIPLMHYALLTDPGWTKAFRYRNGKKTEDRNAF